MSRGLDLLRRLGPALGLAALVGLRAGGPAQADPMLDGDPVDPLTQRVLELIPGVPWIQPGADGRLGTRDDVVDLTTVGDVDLVVRAGLLDFTGPFPPTSPGRGALPEAVARPLADGTPLDFVVAASDGIGPPDAGSPVVSPALEGVPVLLLAYPDLDGDGFVGVTDLDGDPLDHEIEEGELDPVGRRYALMQQGRANGRLFVGVGGPGGAPLRVVLAAVAYAGPLDPAFFGGVVPDGPAVMTSLPSLPRTDPDDVLPGGALGAADPDDLVGVEAEDHFTPEPADAAYGEAFTIPTDGSDPSSDVALVRSGRLARFGLAASADSQRYQKAPERQLRPGLDTAGARVLLEVLHRVVIPRGGTAKPRLLRVVPLDRLGNIADVPAPIALSLRAGGPVRILAPDRDGDPARETITVEDARGLEIVVDAAGSGPGAPDLTVSVLGRTWSTAFQIGRR